MDSSPPEGTVPDAHDSDIERIRQVLDERFNAEEIVHELLHFSVPNHGKLWKSLMRARLGNYEVAGQKLRKIATAGGVLKRYCGKQGG